MILPGVKVNPENSIRSIERLSGIHRDTIMRLGVRVGEACRTILDEKMRGLNCSRLESDALLTRTRTLALALRSESSVSVMSCKPALLDCRALSG